MPSVLGQAFSTSGKTLTRFPKQEKFGESGKAVAVSEQIGSRANQKGGPARVLVCRPQSDRIVIRSGERLTDPLPDDEELDPVLG